VARQLEAGLAAAGVGVCVGEGSAARSVAHVEVAGAASTGGVELRITIRDDVTTKTLERWVRLSSIPEDSRAVAVALYIEELLQASWAELALAKRVYLREHPPSPPRAVTREVASVFPPVSPAALRVSVGGAVETFHGGLVQGGPRLEVGYQIRSWLGASARFGYFWAPTVGAPHGTITAQAIEAGASLDPAWVVTPRWSLHFPQGMDVADVSFFGNPRPDAVAQGGTRGAVVVSHGAALRFALTSGLSVSCGGRFVWTLLPAEASDDGRVVVGLSGLGAEGDLAIDWHF
jgi:hypothetical protein